MLLHNETHHSTHVLSERNLTIVFFLTILFFFIEIAGSLLSNSLALFADAIHMLQDIIALGMSVFAVKLVKRPKDNQHTFGYKRAEVISAFLNGLALFFISLFILYESYTRLHETVQIQSGLMFIVSVSGLCINIIGLLLLKEVQKENINSRGAFLHVLSDTLGSVGAIIASILIFITGQPIFDILVSILITILILISSFKITGQALSILMERTPKSIVLNDIEQKLLEIDGIKNIHDTHAWAVSTDQYNFSCHVEITKESEPCDILSLVTNVLAKEFKIKHTTIQIEHEGKFEDCGSC